MLSVVDKNGEIHAKFAKREDAEDWARSRGMAVMAGDTVLSGQVAQDSELPGMWSASDLVGGEADTQDQVARELGIR